MPDLKTLDLIGQVAAKVKDWKTFFECKSVTSETRQEAEDSEWLLEFNKREEERSKLLTEQFKEVL